VRRKGVSKCSAELTFLSVGDYTHPGITDAIEDQHKNVILYGVVDPL